MSYIYHTVHIDNVHHEAAKTLKTSWVSELVAPIHNIIQISVLKFNFNQSANVTGVPYVYLNIDELQSVYNDVSGVSGNSSTTTSTQEVYPNSKSRARGCVAVIDNNPTTFDSTAADNRTTFLGADYSTQTQFQKPIERIDKLTISILDPNGVSLMRNGSDTNNRNLIQLSLRFTCLPDISGHRGASKKM